MSDLRRTGRPNKQRASVLTEELLDGARSVFSRKGISHSSIEDIALELAISKHTIYRRYSNKRALLEGVVSRDIGLFRDNLRRAAESQGEPLEALRLIALKYFEIGSSRDYSAFYLSVNAEAAFSAELRDQLSQWSREALQPIVDAIIAAQLSQALAPGDPQLICDILVDLMEGANNRIRLRNHATADGSLTAMFDQRWNAFFGGLRASSP